MTDMQVATWLAIMLVIEACAVGAAVWMAFSGGALDLPVAVRAGVLFMTFGLIVQIVRSMHYFEFGRYPVDQYFPLWVTKDFGASLLIFHYAIKSARA